MATKKTAAKAKTTIKKTAAKPVTKKATVKKAVAPVKKTPAKKSAAKTKTVTEKTTKTASDVAALNKMQVTVTIEELNQMIEHRAYELYMQRGSSHGDDHRDWYIAEQEVKGKVKVK